MADGSTLLGNSGNNNQVFNIFSESIETLVHTINEDIKSRKESKGTGRIEDGVKLNDNKFNETMSLNIGEMSTNVRDIREKIIQIETNSNTSEIFKTLSNIYELLSKMFDSINSKTYSKSSEPSAKDVKKKSKVLTSSIDSFQGIVDIINTIKSIEVSDIDTKEISQISEIITKYIETVLNVTQYTRRKEKVNIKNEIKKLDDYVTFIEKSLTTFSNVLKNINNFKNVSTDKNNKIITEQFNTLNSVFNSTISFLSRINLKDFLYLYRNLMIIDNLRIGELISKTLYGILKSFAPKEGLSEESIEAAKGAEAISNTLKNIFEIFSPKSFLKNAVSITLFSTLLKNIVEMIDEVFDKEYGLGKFTTDEFVKIITKLIGVDPTEPNYIFYDQNGNVSFEKREGKGVLAGISNVLSDLYSMFDTNRGEGIGSKIAKLLLYKIYLGVLRNVLFGNGKATINGNLSIYGLISSLFGMWGEFDLGTNTFENVLIPFLKNISNILNDSNYSIEDIFISVSKMIGWSITAKIGLFAIYSAMFGIIGDKYRKASVLGVVEGLYNTKDVIKDFNYINNLVNNLNNLFITLNTVFKNIVQLGVFALLSDIFIGIINKTLFGSMFGKSDKGFSDNSVMGIVYNLNEKLNETLFYDGDFDYTIHLLEEVDKVFTPLANIFKNVVKIGVFAILAAVTMPFLYVAIKLIPSLINVINKINTEKEIDEKVIETIQQVDKVINSLKDIFASVILAGIASVFMIPFMPVVFVSFLFLLVFVSLIDKFKIDSKEMAGFSIAVKELMKTLLWYALAILAVVAVFELIKPRMDSLFIGLGIFLGILFIVTLMTLIIKISIGPKGLYEFAVSVKIIMQSLIWYALGILAVELVFNYVENEGGWMNLLKGLGIFIAIIAVVVICALLISNLGGVPGLIAFSFAVLIIMSSLLVFALGILVLHYALENWKDEDTTKLVNFITSFLGAFGIVEMYKLPFVAIGLFLLGAAFLMFSLGITFLALALKLWDEKKIEILGLVLTGIAEKINMMMQVLLGGTRGKNGESVTGGGTGMPVLDSFLGMLGAAFSAGAIIVISVSLFILSIALVFLGLALMLWDTEKVKILGTVLTGIAMCIQLMVETLLGKTENGSFSSGGSGIPVLDNFLSLLSAVLSAGALVVISIALLVFSVSLTLLGAALLLWSDDKIELLGTILTTIAEKIKLMAESLLGTQSVSGSNTPTVDSVLLAPVVAAVSVMNAVITLGTIIMLSLALVTFAIALKQLGKALDEWGGKEKLFGTITSAIANAIKDMTDTLFGKKGRSGLGGFIEGVVANIPVIGDAVGALGMVAKMGAIVLLSVALVAFGEALKSLGNGLDSIKGKTQSFKPIAYNIGQGVKQLLESFGGADSDEIANISSVSQGLVIFGKALKSIGNIDFENLQKFAPEGENSILKRIVKSIKDSLTSFSESNNGLENSIQSLQKAVNSISKLCNALQVLKSEDQISNVAVGIGKIQSTIQKTEPTPKALKSFSTIMYHLCKISYAADKFEKFTNSFKVFTKDMEVFKNTLNGFDGEKLKDFIKLNKVQLELSKEADAYNKFVKELENYFKTYSTELQNIFKQFTEFESAMAQARATSAEDLVSKMGDKQGDELTKFLIGLSATNGDGTAAICAKLDEIKLYMKTK